MRSAGALAGVSQVLDFTEAEAQALGARARAGGLEQLANDCQAACEGRLPLTRCAALQAAVEAWRAAELKETNDQQTTA